MATPSSSAEKKLGEILVESGHLTLAQLEEALAVQAREGEIRRRLGQILVSRGHCTMAQVQVALAKQRALRAARPRAVF